MTCATSLEAAIRRGYRRVVLTRRRPAKKDGCMQALDDPDPVAGLQPGQQCWCGSGERHAACHGNPLPPSQPGAPITETDDEDEVWISPSATVDRAWLISAIPGAPIYLPSDELTPPPVIVPEIVARMTKPRDTTTLDLAALGAHRFAALDSMGLADPNRLTRRLAQLSQAEIDELRFFFLDLAKSTLDSLAGQDRAAVSPAIIWAGDADPAAMVGATLLWADHYLVNDRIAEMMISSSRPAAFEDELRAMLALRPLIETGMVVPVLEDAAALIADEAVRSQTERDLRTPGLADWISGQLVMEGPTARECLIYSVLDDDEPDATFFMRAPIVAADEEARHTTSRVLGPYDPSFDYGPWIAQTRRETVAALVHNVNRHVAIADAFGAEWVTTSPFKQRLLSLRGAQPSGAQALIRANVPQLSGASARALARVAAADDTVAALREATRKSLHAMRSLPPAEQREAAAELGRKLQGRSDALSREMKHARRWKRDIPGAAAAAAGYAATQAVAIGATGPLAGRMDLYAGIAALLGTAAAVSPYRADRAAQRANPAFALIIGDGLVTPRPTARPRRQKPVATITAILS